MENGWIDFLGYLYFNSFSFVIIFMIVFIVYYLTCIRKIYIDIFDPLSYAIMASIFSITVPIYMYYEDIILDDSIFIVNILSEIFYILGLIVFSKYKNIDKYLVINKNNVKNIIDKKYVYYLYVVIFFGIKIFFYIRYGIPLIDFDNQVDALLANGIIAKITVAITPVLIFLCLDRICNEKYIDTIPVAIGIIINLLLSGSKGSILIIVFSLFFYKLYLKKFDIKNDINFKRIYIVFFTLAVVAVFIPIGYRVSEGVDIDILMEMFLVRLVGYGDIYPYLYNSNILNNILYNNDFYNLFIKHYAAIFRLVEYDNSMGTIGYQIVTNIYGTMAATAAPISRHHIFGLVCFGMYLAPIYSFILGLITSFICRYIYIKLIGINIYIYILYTIIYSGIISCANELTYGMDIIIFGILFNSIILIICYFIKYLFDIKRLS